MRTRQQTHRSWVFTLNNYESQDEHHLKGLYPSYFRYLCVGREVGAQGTPHLQGFFIATSPIRLANCKRTLGDRYHFEPARGTSTQAADYCKKDGDFWELGQLRGEQGRRVDLESACEELSKHRDLARFKLEHPSLWVKYPRGFSTLLDKSPRREKPKTCWIYGPTGVGKTRFVHDKFGATHSIWFSSGPMRWFDGYYDQEVCVFDDFRGSYLQLSVLLRLLDRYPVRVEIKGGSVEFTPRYIFITSPFSPRETYPGVEDVGQLLRRLDFLLHFGRGGEITKERIDVPSNRPSGTLHEYFPSEVMLWDEDSTNNPEVEPAEERHHVGADEEEEEGTDYPSDLESIYSNDSIAI